MLELPQPLTSPPEVRRAAPPPACNGPVKLLAQSSARFASPPSIGSNPSGTARLWVECITQPDAGWVGFVCGDWVGEHWRLRAERLFRGETLATDRAVFINPHVSGGAAGLGAEFAKTDASLSPDIASAQARYAQAVSRLRQPRAQDSPLSGQVLAGLAVAAADLKRTVRDARAEWVTAKRWRGGP